MKYYVTADVHGYFDELKTALTRAGYFEDTQPHKLIICGDLYDRGKQAQELQAFILDLMSRDEVILIRGNHEDLTLRLLYGWHRGSFLEPQHHHNGTVDTLFQLTGTDMETLAADTEELGRKFLQTPYVQTIIPAMVDYYETEHYVFVHGWIPCIPVTNLEYRPVENWRSADKRMWDAARWVNGMEAAHAGLIEPDKTIVCGHFHCSFGHARYENDGDEYENANVAPYYAEGIIALDARTAVSKIVNCIVIED